MNACLHLIPRRSCRSRSARPCCWCETASWERGVRDVHPAGSRACRRWPRNRARRRSSAVAWRGWHRARAPCARSRGVVETSLHRGSIQDQPRWGGAAPVAHLDRSRELPVRRLGQESRAPCPCNYRLRLSPAERPRPACVDHRCHRRAASCKSAGRCHDGTSSCPALGGIHRRLTREPRLTPGAGRAIG